MGRLSSDAYKHFAKKRIYRTKEGDDAENKEGEDAENSSSNYQVILECKFAGCDYYVEEKKLYQKDGTRTPSKLHRHLDTEHGRENWKRKSEGSIQSYTQKPRSKALKSAQLNPKMKELVNMFIETKIAFRKIEVPSMRRFVQKYHEETPPSRSTLSRRSFLIHGQF